MSCIIPRSIDTKTCAIGILEAKIAQPKVDSLGFGSSSTFRDFFAKAVSMIPEGEDGSAIFRAIRDFEWLWDWMKR